MKDEYNKSFGNYQVNNQHFNVTELLISLRINNYIKKIQTNYRKHLVYKPINKSIETKRKDNLTFGNFPNFTGNNTVLSKEALSNLNLEIQNSSIANLSTPANKQDTNNAAIDYSSNNPNTKKFFSNKENNNNNALSKHTMKLSLESSQFKAYSVSNNFTKNKANNVEEVKGNNIYSNNNSFGQININEIVDLKHIQFETIKREISKESLASPIHNNSETENYVTLDDNDVFSITQNEEANNTSFKEVDGKYIFYPQNTKTILQ